MPGDVIKTSGMWQLWLLQAVLKHLEMHVYESQHKARGQELHAAKGGRSAGVCGQLRNCTQVSHVELTPKSTVLKKTTARAPGQHKDLCMAVGEGSQLLLFRGKRTPGVAQTPLWLKRGSFLGQARDPLAAGFGTVTSWVPTLSLRQCNEASTKMKEGDIYFSQGFLFRATAIDRVCSIPTLTGSW